MSSASSTPTPMRPVKRQRYEGQEPLPCPPNRYYQEPPPRPPPNPYYHQPPPGPNFYYQELAASNPYSESIRENPTSLGDSNNHDNPTRENPSDGYNEAESNHAGDGNNDEVNPTIEAESNHAGDGNNDEVNPTIEAESNHAGDGNNDEVNPTIEAESNHAGDGNNDEVNPTIVSVSHSDSGSCDSNSNSDSSSSDIRTTNINAEAFEVFSAMPNTIKHGCDNPMLREIVHKAGRETFQEMRSHHAIRCPTTAFTRHKLAPLMLPSSQPVIYALFDETGSLSKIGYSSHILNRYSKEELQRCFIMVSPRAISPELDEKLVNHINKLLDDVIGNDQIPKDFRLFFQTIRDRGADLLGLKKALYYQIIEIGCQLEYNVSVPAEAFTTSEQEQRMRRSHVNLTTKDAIAKDDLQFFVGWDFKALSTWATGQQEGLFASQVVLNDYVFGIGKWKNPMPNAAVPNATTREAIYSTDWSEEEIDAGRQRILSTVRHAIREKIVLFLAKNEEKLFPQNRLLKRLTSEEFGFEVTHSIHGGRIVSLTLGAKKAKIILYSPLGYAMDSRPETINESPGKVRTAQEADILCNFVDYLSNKPIDYHKEAGQDALTGMHFFESAVENYHLNTRVGAAVFRDASTPDSVFACKQNNLKKSNPNKISPRARRAETKSESRPINSGIVVEALNLLSFSANWKEWASNLFEVQRLFGRDNPPNFTFYRRWEYLLKTGILPEAKQLLKDSNLFIQNHLRKNPGNRTGNDPKNIDNNNDLIAFLWDGKEFIVQPKKSKMEHETNFDPTEYPEWKCFQDCYYVHTKNFVYAGIKEHLRHLQGKRHRANNTNHKRVRGMEGDRALTIVGRYFCKLGDKSSEPIYEKSIPGKRYKHYREEGSEYTEFCLCRLVGAGVATP